MRLAGLVLAAVLAAAALPCPAATDPALAGAFTPGRRQVSIPATQGATLDADLHFPDDGSGGLDAGAGRCPVVVFGHGFARSRARYADLGRHLASRGWVAIVPDFAGFSDHSRNADDLIACLDWALAQEADPASELFERIDTDALGTSGHSAGGLSALLAFARDPRVRASAPLDPVDSGGLGAAELPGAGRPVAITFSEDSACNANGSARTLYDAATPPKRSVRIVGANHCDPEMPSDALCGFTCGAAVAARQALYRKVVTGWLEMYVRCDPDYAPWVGGTEMQADVAAGLVAYAADPDPPPLPCVSTGSPPDEVTGLRVAKAGPDARLSWDPVTAAPPVTEYRVYRDADPRFGSGGAPRSSASTSFDDPGVRDDGVALWCWLVRAVNVVGEGP